MTLSHIMWSLRGKVGWHTPLPTVDVDLPRGMVSFTFDDFPRSALEIGGALLERAGHRGTFYAATAQLGTTTDCGEIADAADLADCLARGHEVANHTHDHPDCRQLSNRAIVRQIDSGRARLPAGASANFAYPYGASDGRVQRAVLGTVATARGIRDGINGLDTCLVNLCSNRVYSHLDLARLHALVEANRTQRGWLIFGTHDVSDAPSPFGCTPSELAGLIAAVDAAGLEVVTIEAGRRRLAGA